MGFIEGLILSPIFWIPALFIFLGVEAYLVENRRPGLASIIFVCTLLVLQLFTSIAPFTMIVANPVAALGFLAAYVLIGMAVTYVKWRSYVNRQMETIAERVDQTLADDLLRTHDTGETPIERRQNLIKQAINDVLGYRETLPIQIRDHKVRATTWMAYWPVSALYYVFDDPIRRVFQYCYRSMSGVLQDYLNKATNDFH
ncbi:MAG: hypothetical protein EOO77_30150, partial [Oxalobacteraceae bacterium]